MKGHVGDGAPSASIKVAVTGNQADATSCQAPQSGCDDTCSFVSITFDSAGIGSLIFWLVEMAGLALCLIG